MTRDEWLAKFDKWSEEREAIFELEANTGMLDHDAIWASDDQAVFLTEMASIILGGGENEET